MTSEAARKAWETIRAKRSGTYVEPEPGARRVFAWTEHQLNRLRQAEEILEDLKDYKPLTLRQIYYQFVGKGYIANKLSQYNGLSGTLKWARIEGRISWDDIEDRTRVLHELQVWKYENFVDSWIGQFLTGYKRDLMQSQDKYVEVWVEKDALSGIMTQQAEPFTVPVVVNRGFASVSFLHDYHLRIERHPDKHPVILYFGDFDPSGMKMLPSIQETLEDEMGVTGVEYKRVALEFADIAQYNLPHNPDAIKWKDPRAREFVDQYGEVAVELDALDVRVLAERVRDAILDEIDIDLFNAERERETEERNTLTELKSRAEEAFKNLEKE